MGQKKLIIGFQDQKPLGTRKEDFEYSLYSCYKPLLTFLYANPEIRISLYFSGIIYEWIENEFPEINMLIADMVKRKQIELLSGGYYDPILHIIPLKDRTLQIEKTTTYIRKRFGYRPRCAWISEQVWDPTLINTLSLCGILGLLQNYGNLSLLHQPFTMQEMGKTVTIYPIEKNISSNILHNELEDFRHHLTIAYKKNTTDYVSVMLDMNKIAASSILATENNIVGLCSAIKDVCIENHILTCLPSEEIRSIDTVQDYLPSGWYKDEKPSELKHYNEMFIKYPEIQLLYGKLLYVSKLIPGIKKEKTLKKLASKELLKAESFGGFSISQNGGMYQNYLRKMNYYHLIEVEKISREKGVFATSLTAYDIDFDNDDEFIYRGKNITSVFDMRGASVVELDYLVNSWNYLDTFVGQADELISRSITTLPDGKKQNTFLDLFIRPGTDLDVYDKYNELSIHTLEDSLYALVRLDKEKKQITLCNEFLIENDSEKRITIEKTFVCRTNTIQLNYTITNTSRSRCVYWFGSEMNLSFACDSDELLEMLAIDVNHTRKLDPETTSMNNIKLLRIRDLHKKALVSIYAEKRYRIYKKSYTTTMQTIMGEEEIYQYTRFLPVWELDLKPDETWKNTISIRIEKMK